MMNSVWSEETMQSWLDAQRQYWEKLVNISQENSKPLGDFNESLSRVLSGVPLSVRDVLERVLEMGQVYTQLGEQVLKSAHHTPKFDDWMSVIESALNQWLQKSQSGHLRIDSLISGLAVAESWGHVVERMPELGKWLGEHSQESAQRWQEQFFKTLALLPMDSVPNNLKDRLQHLSVLATDYQQALHAYLGAFSRQNIAAMSALRARVQEMAAEEKSITSLRELFDLWVDACEGVYANFAMSDEYQVIYGDLVNAFMRLKLALNHFQDEHLCHMNLPTRADMNGILQQQQNLRCEQRAFRQQLQRLEQQVASLSAATNPAVSSASGEGA